MNSERMIADLMRPEAFLHEPEKVDLVETHISWVFLAGELVYKLKKPLDFGFLDFTSLEKREYFCHEEVRLNRRLAPDIYLGMRPVTLDEGGRCVMGGGTGDPVEFAVEMKRLPEEDMMYSLLDRGEIGPETMDRITGVLVEFYKKAETGERINLYGRREFIKHNTDEDFWQTIDYVDKVISGGRYDHIQQYNDDFIEEQADLLERRIDGGYIRDCHGDLHMGNICLGDKVWIFDCIEFNEALRYSDAAADLAFLAMDLDFNGRPDLSNRLINGYSDLAKDEEIYGVLDFYKCYRAYVRGKINCFAGDQAGGDREKREKAFDLARRYFDLAYVYAGGRRRPRVFVFFGLMGAGKTHWARKTARKTGAMLLSSDRLRKKTAGLSSKSRVYVPFGQGLYSADITEKVYEAMHSEADKAAGAGMDVVLDASYMKKNYRKDVMETAARTGAELVFINVRANEETVMSRLKKREENGRSMSDGRREIYGAQVTAFESLDDLEQSVLIELDNSGSENLVEYRLWKMLGL